MLRDVALYVWHFWLFGLACVLYGIALAAAIPAAALLFIAEAAQETADVLAYREGIPPDDSY